MGPLEVLVYLMPGAEPIWFLGIVAVTFMIVGLPVGFVGFIVWLFQGAKPVSQRIEEDRLRTAALERLSG